jgi:pimeloyl-ACP methyl ester carboxylesterase
MQDTILKRIYNRVPPAQKERLWKFRSSHSPKHLIRDGYDWEYISCGNGSETLVLLPGGMRFGDAWFLLIMALENQFHIIAPTYPQVTTMTGLIEGIVGVMESERIQAANFLGSSLGGWLAQCLVRQYPDKVNRLILSNTSPPNILSVKQAKIGILSVCYFPFGYMRFVSKRRLMQLMSPPDSEREFWKAYLKEKFSMYVSKKDVLSQMKYTFDYVSNYKFTPVDLVEWRGKLLILESDDDLAVQKTVRESLRPLYPMARTYTLHNAGHTPGYRGVLEYVDIVKKFLTDTLENIPSRE